MFSCQTKRSVFSCVTVSIKVHPSMRLSYQIKKQKWNVVCGLFCPEKILKINPWIQRAPRQHGRLNPQKLNTWVISETFDLVNKKPRKSVMVFFCKTLPGDLRKNNDSCTISFITHGKRLKPAVLLMPATQLCMFVPFWIFHHARVVLLCVTKAN